MNMSSLPLFNGALYNKETHKIAEGGPLDLRLVFPLKKKDEIIKALKFWKGVGEKYNVCSTCFKRLIDCPGHFGHFGLALPVFHVGYFKYVVSILQCICKVKITWSFFGLIGWQKICFLKILTAITILFFLFEISNLSSI